MQTFLRNAEGRAMSLTRRESNHSLIEPIRYHGRTKAARKRLAKMITQSLDLAKWVREVQNRGRELGLSTEETAFYDAIAENESARKAMENDKLRLMARELAEMVKRLPKLDWSQRESVRADLRRQVRRLLARYGYPPDLSEDATQLVLKQAKLSTANGE
jgi:type I restriction enzyme R subunit